MMKVDQGLEVEVVRREFFQGSRGTLTYVESAPPAPAAAHEHQVCNCTREVATRPVGSPFETKVSVMMKQSGRERDFSVTLGESPWYTFRWGESHAYFIAGKNELRAQISLPGQGLADYLFGHLYFGRTVDTSTMMNGHSPSRIVDLGKLAPTDVWIHGCSWGKEAVAHITDEAEKAKWWEIRLILDRTHELSVRYEKSTEPVDRIREQVIRDEKLTGMVAYTRDWFLHVLDHLHETNFYRAADQVEKESRKR